MKRGRHEWKRTTSVQFRRGSVQAIVNKLDAGQLTEVESVQDTSAVGEWFLCLGVGMINVLHGVAPP